MTTINIHEAKIHLSRLVDLAASGDSFVIAKAGKAAPPPNACKSSDQQTRLISRNR